MLCPKFELPVASVGQWHDHKMHFLDIHYMCFKEIYIFFKRVKPFP